MYSGHTKPVKNEDPKYNGKRYIHKEGCECVHCKRDVESVDEERGIRILAEVLEGVGVSK